MAEKFSQASKTGRNSLLIGTLLSGVALAVLHQFASGNNLRIAETALRCVGLILFFLYAWLRKSQMVWIFFAMLAGVELGLDAPAIAGQTHILSDIFLRLIKTIVAPLVLCTLISGILEQKGAGNVGKLAFKSLLYFEVVTAFALVVGLIAINLSHAGQGALLHGTAHIAGVSSELPAVFSANQPRHWTDYVVHIFPENIAKSIAEGQILQVAMFAIFFGLALSKLPENKQAPLRHLIDALGSVMFRFTDMVMRFAPFAVGAALATAVSQMGPAILLICGKLLLTLYIALAVFLLVILLPIAWFCHIPIKRFMAMVAEPAAIAFATSASEAALPRAMEAMEEFGVSKRVVAFVLPAGYSFNLDGSTLYLALATMFVAQAAGRSVPVGEQIIMMLMLMLASKGIAGIPRATLIVLMAMASTFQFPKEPIVLLLGIDAVMDMARTATNVIGNCLACAVVGQWEGEFDAHKALASSPDTSTID